ncbi:hypothetical protein GTA08_BOTSDO12935 [Neofusicoccum parvum]|uniref:Uncharacterized protein n=1 Tax=Neofusicoccum parvum TaxID=310453 RepID=A0ACB5SEE6_9PEZI|nr:hypothetical protein GTA08_BOTSDO12935 [Neofusicoccum parvum]
MSFSPLTLLALTLTLLLPLLHRLTHHLTYLPFPPATPLASLLPTTLTTTILAPRPPYRTAHLHAAHTAHGPILRTGPRSLSLATPAAAAAIYGHAAPTAKGPLYAALAPGPHTNVLHAVDRAVHAAKRRRLAHGFSLRKTAAAWEARVRGKVAEVVAAFDGSAGADLDVARWANLFTVEAVADLVGSWRLGCLERGDDVVAVGDGGPSVRYIASLRAGNGATARAALWAPEWLGVVKPVLSWVSGWYRGKWEEGRGYGELIRVLVRERVGRAEQGEVLDDKSGTPLGLDVEELEAEVGVLLDAGSDTTAIALANVMYFLVENPSTFAKLRKELDNNLPAGTTIPAYSSLMQLPYLRASLDEFLRIIPPVSLGLSRITPPEGMDIAGHWIPGGTTVSVPAYTLHRNPSIFPDPEEYRPERWLGGKIGEMNSAFMPFSLGARGCIGRNITYMEQSVLVATLVRRYDFALPNPRWELEREEAFNVWPGTMPLKIKLRSE